MTECKRNVQEGRSVVMMCDLCEAVKKTCKTTLHPEHSCDKITDPKMGKQGLDEKKKIDNAHGKLGLADEKMMLNNCSIPHLHQSRFSILTSREPCRTISPKEGMRP